MPKRKRDALHSWSCFPNMRGITLSSLCLLMHLLQEETTTILVLESRDLQELIKPQKVEFHSLNFNNTLRWLPGRASKAQDTVYYVQYKVYGQSTWQNKEDCWGIQNHFCDLTNETSNVQEPYYGRVKAASAGVYSDWNLSCRFTPWQETMIGPPSVNVVHRNKSIILKLQAPRSPYKRKRGSNIPMTNYYDMLYQVFIINNLLDEKHSTLVYEGADKVITIKDLRPGVSYCIMVKTYVPMLDRSSAYSSRQCTVLL
ncbi:interleukin-22 receptor subunit alpha-2 isoform X1 [Apteryx rowi]|uniref:interleukin-22 receptor subunit alpha-2 isoform X1 n=1 Tax=Apteryx rowi TaxID=308060 RepID=UPI0006B07601|nr:PREDICTED: interleukin-22 receptor subunit alpha-2 [Apteryx mantelli mantelli]XP_025932017.1 interleukin-22 receptor subunit alpha-2 isoform X1 [Apteryx rowi]